MRCALALFVLALGLTGCGMEKDFGIDSATVHCGGRKSNLGDGKFLVERNRGVCYAVLRLARPRHYTSRGPGGASWVLHLDVESFEPEDEERFAEAELQVCDTRGNGCAHFSVDEADVGGTVKVAITGIQLEQPDNDWELVVHLDRQGAFRGVVRFSGGSLRASSQGDGNSIFD